MFELLEKLRQKPDKVKKLVAVIFSLFFAGIIFVLWFSVSYQNWTNSKYQEEKVTEEPSPISTFSSTFSGAFKSIGEQFSQIRKIIPALISGPVQNVSTTSTSSNQSISTTTIR